MEAHGNGLGADLLEQNAHYILETVPNDFGKLHDFDRKCFKFSEEEQLGALAELITQMALFQERSLRLISDEGRIIEALTKSQPVFALLL